MKIQTSCFDLAQRYVGMEEISGKMSNPAILAMLRLDARWVEDDDTPWCSAFTNWIAWHLRLPRSKSLAARSWLSVGRPITLIEADAENDVVIFKRGGGSQPGPEVLKAPGHVGFFARYEPATQGAVGRVWVIGGNQSDAVTVAPFPEDRVLGVRSLLG